MILKIHHLQDVIYHRVDVVHFFGEHLLEEIPHGELELVAWNHLPREPDRKPFFYVYIA
jgi:hypothetical protein